MKFSKSFLASLACIACAYTFSFTEARAGGWVAGGGNIIQHADNPWFLKNDKPVNYCVQIDEANFGITNERAHELISKAFDYWKSEFKHLTQMLPIEGFRINTENYVSQTACDQSSEITFQFGVLSDQQKAQQIDYQSHLALSIRTDYDKEQMRGQGFIYLSPQAGRWKFKGEHLIDRPWSQFNNGLVYAALIHEIGHVLGIPHNNFKRSGYGTPQIMAANFIENQLSKGRSTAASKEYWARLPKPALFRFDEDPEFNNRFGHRCTIIRKPKPGGSADSKKETAEFKINQPLGGTSNFNKFFGIPAHYQCNNIKRVNSKKVEIWAYKYFDDQAKMLVGTVEAKRIVSGSLETVSKLWLPKEQKLFEVNAKMLEVHHETYVRSSNQTHDGVFKPATGNGAEKQLLLRYSLKGRNPTMYYTVDGKTYVAE